MPMKALSGDLRKYLDSSLLVDFLKSVRVRDGKMKVIISEHL